MSTKISENTNIQLDLKTVVAIIMVTASFVGMYYTLQADIEEAKKLPPIEVTRLEYELKEEWNEKMIIQLKDQVEMLEQTQDILKEEISITASMIDIPTAGDIEEVVINGDVVDNGAAPLVVHSKRTQGAEQGA